MAVDFGIIGGVFAFEVLAAIDLHRRIRLLSGAHLILGYIIISQVVFIFSPPDVVWDTMRRLGAQYSFTLEYTRTLVVYAVVYAVVYLASWGLHIKIEGGRSNLSGLLNAASSIGVAGAILANIAVLLNLVTLDLDVTWFNTVYLMMQGPSGYKVDSNLALILRALLELSGLISVGFLTLAVCQAKWALAILSLPPALFCFMFQLSAHSRYAVVYASVAAFVACIALRRARWFVFILLCALAVGALMYALAGRSGGMHGIGSIGANLELLSDAVEQQWFYRILLNVFQGMFVTSAGLNLTADYPTSYKVLSFSPLPSAVDGFNDLLVSNQRRVSEFVPYSSLAEVYWFGDFYVVFGALFLFLCVRRALRLYNSNKYVLTMMVNFLVFFLFVFANSYPIRNVFRQAFFVLVISEVLRRSNRNVMPFIRAKERQLNGGWRDGAAGRRSSRL